MPRWCCPNDVHATSPSRSDSAVQCIVRIIHPTPSIQIVTSGVVHTSVSPLRGSVLPTPIIHRGLRFSVFSVCRPSASRVTLLSEHFPTGPRTLPSSLKGFPGQLGSPASDQTGRHQPDRPRRSHRERKKTRLGSLSRYCSLARALSPVRSIPSAQAQPQPQPQPLGLVDCSLALYRRRRRRRRRVGR